MKGRFWLAIMLLAVLPSFAYAQGRGKVHGNGKGHNKEAMKANKHGNTGVNNGNWQRTKGGPPPWAPAHGYRAKNHVYFPDYYTFYDPNRGGYVYWNNNNWAFSPSVPGFLSGVNLGTARLQVLQDIGLVDRPEAYYSRYAQSYPARQVNINVNIPHP